MNNSRTKFNTLKSTVTVNNEVNCPAWAKYFHFQTSNVFVFHKINSGGFLVSQENGRSLLDPWKILPKMADWSSKVKNGTENANLNIDPESTAQWVSTQWQSNFE